MQGKPGRPRKTKYRPWRDIPRAMSEIAYERTEFLALPHPLQVQPFRTALANAYLQGIADAAETFGANDDNA